MDGMLIAQALGILVVFLGLIGLMIARKIPTMLALPIMAILFAIIAGVPFMSSNAEDTTIFTSIIQQGSMRMSDAVASLLFGAMFAQVLNKTGITRAIVKKAAELGGGSALVSAIVFFFITAVVFTGGSGLGMYILVGNIVIPILISLGISPFNAGLVLLLGGTVGSSLNVSGWSVMTQTLGIELSTITDNLLIPLIPFAAVCLAMIVLGVKKDVAKHKAWAMPVSDQDDDDEVSSSKSNVPMLAFISPLIPVVLVWGFKFTILPAIIIAMLYVLIIIRPKRPMQVVSSSLIEGTQDTASAIALFMGLGMLMAAVSSPQVSGVISPFVNAIIPNNILGYILFFIVLAPLSLYRGPLAPYGLGAGIASLFLPGGMNPTMAFLGWQAIGDLSGVADPTQSYIIWIADYTKSDPVSYMKKVLPGVMISTAVTILIGCLLVL